MLCCFDRKDAERLGFVRVKTETVIEASRKTIGSIHRTRSRLRRQYVDKYVADATWWWSHLWRFLGFRRPTRRDALYAYYHGDRIPTSFDVNMTSGLQESNCEKLLRAAQVSERPTMWIGPDGVRACNLQAFG